MSDIRTYLCNWDAGVDKDKIIVLDNSTNIQKHAGSVRADLLAIPGIDAVSFTNCIPTRGASVSSEVSWDGKDASEKLHFWYVNSDFDYNKSVKVKMVEGRFFNPSFSTDSAAYMINDVAARVMKNSNPVGSTITLEGRKGTIIGVFKDFHSIDLAGPFVPTIFRRTAHCCSCNIIDSKFSNLERSKPEPGKSSQVRIKQILPTLRLLLTTILYFKNLTLRVYLLLF